MADSLIVFLDAECRVDNLLSLGEGIVVPNSETLIFRNGADDLTPTGGETSGEIVINPESNTSRQSIVERIRAINSKRPLFVMVGLSFYLQITDLYAERRIYVDPGKCGDAQFSNKLLNKLTQNECCRLASSLDLILAASAERLEKLRHSFQYFGSAHIWDGQPGITSDIHSCLNARVSPKTGKLKVLVLCAPSGLHVDVIRESLEALWLFSRHEIFFCRGRRHGTGARLPSDHQPVDFQGFDAIVIHYSLRISFANIVDPEIEKAISDFGGFKLLWIQDEYDNIYRTWEWIRKTGVHHVLTLVPEISITKVFPPKEVPGVGFTKILTGCVPFILEECLETTPHEDRPYLIVYRGRTLSPIYGSLGQEKMEIGVRMRKICESQGLPVDIDWTEESRIYDGKWYNFLQSGRATLGTESGSNVFDLDGSIQECVKNYQKKYPDASYQDVASHCFEEDNLGVQMNQLSPKLFEAIALKTALILFEGDYSGILEPDRHYIVLKKNFSNVEEVLSKVNDLNFIEDLTARTYQEIVVPGEYRHDRFVGTIDNILSKALAGSRNWKLNDWREAIPREIAPPTLMKNLTSLDDLNGLWEVSELIKKTSLQHALEIEQFEGKLASFEKKMDNFRGMISRRDDKISKLKEIVKEEELQIHKKRGYRFFRFCRKK